MTSDIRRQGVRELLSDLLLTWLLCCATSTVAVAAQEEEDRAGAQGPNEPGAALDPWSEEPEIPSVTELRELISQAESVARRPHAVRLESFRGDTISGVYLVDSDLPSARHVAFGRDAQGHRYVWFSRRNPLRSSMVALYDVNADGRPDLLYWRQVHHEARVARAREFRAPAAADTEFEYSAGSPCGRPACELGWRELPLTRMAVRRSFFRPLEELFEAAIRHGSPHLDRPIASLKTSEPSRVQ